MKTPLLLTFVFYCTLSFGQNTVEKNIDREVVLDNEKMKVVKYVSKSQGEVCGNGMHHHDEHLTVALNDAQAVITSPDGKKNEVEIPADAAIWFEAGTHSVINTGASVAKFLLIYMKE